MDAIEFYMGELEEALGPFGNPPYSGTVQRLVDAARGVLTAWDAENTPEEG